MAKRGEVYVRRGEYVALEKVATAASVLVDEPWTRRSVAHAVKVLGAPLTGFTGRNALFVAVPMTYWRALNELATVMRRLLTLQVTPEAVGQLHFALAYADRVNKGGQSYEDNFARGEA
jgi:hypothetical protein